MHNMYDIAKMSKHVFLMIMFILCSKLDAQQALPIGYAPDEVARMPAYLQQARISGSAQPPAGSELRTMAEWEEIQALTITWTGYPSILKEIVRAAQLETQIYIVCSDSITVQNYLTGNSIPLTNIHYTIAPFNSIWIRDYGQNTVYSAGIDSILLVDWIYNRPRPADDTIPAQIGRQLGIPLYETTQSPFDLIHTGGNFMSDGFGTGFSSELVLNENPQHTPAEIDTIMKQFMGIQRYIKMPVLPFDGIHHIDMHMKLLDEQTLLVGQYPTGIADGPQIEANLQYVLSTFNSVYGTPYRVVRIPMPPDQFGDYPDQQGYYRTYTNAVFANKTVLLPIYDPQYDSTALRIWQEALPGYTIKTIDCNSIIPSGGAIHCISHSVGVNDPLLIAHQQLENTINATTSYTVNATIRHRTGIQTATLYWTTDTAQPWQTVSMLLTNASTHTFSAAIPSQVAGTSIYYYIEATAVSGKTQVRPMPAPAGWWKFQVQSPSSIITTTSTRPQFEAAFPNPSRGLTCIPITSSVVSAGQLCLIDMTGRMVQVIYSGNFPSGTQNYFFDSSQLASGAYQLVLQTDRGQAFQQLMVR